MSLLAILLSKALPKPKDTGKYEQLPSHAHARGLKILGIASRDEARITIQVSCNEELNINSDRCRLIYTTYKARTWYWYCDSYSVAAPRRMEHDQDGDQDLH